MLFVQNACLCENTVYCTPYFFRKQIRHSAISVQTTQCLFLFLYLEEDLFSHLLWYPFCSMDMKPNLCFCINCSNANQQTNIHTYYLLATIQWLKQIIMFKVTHKTLMTQPLFTC